MLCVYLYPNLGCGKEPAHQQCRRQETWVQSLSQEDPLEESMQPTQPTPVLLPGESHGQRSLVGYSPWGCEESDTADVTQHTEMIYSVVLVSGVPHSDSVSVVCSFIQF